MARKISAPTEAEQPAEAGHNLTQETFLHFVNVFAAADAKLAEAKSARAAVRKQAKAAGIELNHIDAVRRMADWDREEVQDFFSTRLRYAQWYALPVHTQGDLFVAPPADEVVLGAEQWAAKGFQAGVMGLVGTPPSECPPEHVQDWQHGWGDGQAKIVEGLKGAG